MVLSSIWADSLFSYLATMRINICMFCISYDAQILIFVMNILHPVLCAPFWSVQRMSCDTLDIW